MNKKLCMHSKNNNLQREQSINENFSLNRFSELNHHKF